jgi:N-acetylglucosaminyldiphosphoundecaprenol N-acetyl-beta-D-mannosaminyltransferase
MQPSASLSMRALALVLNINAHCLNLVQDHAWLCEVLNRAELGFCYGAGVQFAARILGGEFL